MTQVPIARHTTIGASSTSAALGGTPIARTFVTTFRASKRIFRLVLPTESSSASTSM